MTEELGIPLASGDRDSDYFERRAAEARRAAFSKEPGEAVDVAGELALAYAAMARRRASTEA
jgi:hypothetical protein